MQGRHKTSEKEQQIVRAAAEVFANRDFHRVLMDDVAARAGVGKGTQYRYFPTKDDLYFATIFAGLEEIKAEVEALAVRGGSARGVLEAIGTGLLRQILPRRSHLPRMLHSASGLSLSRGPREGTTVARPRRPNPSPPRPLSPYASSPRARARSTVRSTSSGRCTRTRRRTSRPRSMGTSTRYWSTSVTV